VSGKLLGASSRGRRLLFVALLVAAIATNLAQFGAADRGAETLWQAIHRYDTSSVAELSFTDSSFAEERHIRLAYSLYRALAELAPGSTVILLPEATRDTVAKLYGVSDVASVRTNRSEALDTMLAGFDPGPFIVASGEGGRCCKNRTGDPWGVALDEPDPRPADLRDPAEFLPAILAADRQGEARGGPRELVMVKWADPDIPPEFDYRLVLVETSLLPPAVREAVSR
jgi:hypothetical protein